MEEFQHEKPDGFGIHSDFFKNSTDGCFSDKTQTEKLKHNKESALPALYFISLLSLIGILSEKETVVISFMISSLNSSNKIRWLHLIINSLQVLEEGPIICQLKQKSNLFCRLLYKSSILIKK